MINSLKILIFAIVGLSFFCSNAQISNKQEIPVLFTDRDFCISGDTVWFKVWLPKMSQNTGNIVRVQLDNKANNLISEVAVKSKNGWAQGFIYVPDSLSTGQYFLTAFVNHQRNNSGIEMESNSLLVYNRFAESISQIEIIKANSNEQIIDNKPEVTISTNKKEYQTREKVEVEIDLNPEVDVSNIIIKATLVDPLAEQIRGKYKFRMKSSNSFIPVFDETDGLLLSGKVSDTNGEPQTDALVALSIGGDQPYFDYYVLGENGDFHFFIKNAFGNANVVLQVVSNSQKEYFIQIENNCIVRNELIQSQNQILTQDQVEFINSAINSNFAHKLFNPAISANSGSFQFPARFEAPFYGQPTERIIPDEFIDLPNFQEISRELIPGLQYRSKNGEVTFRLINSTYRMFFEVEPFRLINGIPVFKNDLFVNLKSTDISFIDIVRSERIFGDLIFKGVLAVSLYDKSNSWLFQQANIFEFNVNFLQQEKTPDYLIEQSLSSNQPDMRQAYFWEIMEADSIRNIDFTLSDRKGKVEISVEGFTSDNEFFKTSKTIEVK